jgi:hypothetical protein
MSKLTEFAFDVTLAAAVRVRATSLEEAHKLLKSTIEASDANLGSWPNGDPILAEVSVDGEADLFEINGTTLYDQGDELIAAGSRFYVLENERHGYRIVRLSDGAEATFYGDDSCERFRDHFHGDETTDDPAENAEAADDVGDWAEEKNEFTTADEREQIAATLKEQYPALVR